MKQEKTATKKALKLEVKSLATRIAPSGCAGAEHREWMQDAGGGSDAINKYLGHDGNNGNSRDGSDGNGSGGRGLVIGIN